MKYGMMDEEYSHLKAVALRNEKMYRDCPERFAQYMYWCGWSTADVRLMEKILKGGE